MEKRSPEPKPAPDPAPAKNKQPPITIKKQQWPPDALKRREQFRKDSIEIEGNIRRSIYS